jgi:hypothetical protein
MKQRDTLEFRHSKQWLTRVLALIAIAAFAGCASMGGDKKEAKSSRTKGMTSAQGGQVTLEELGQFTTGFADRYMTYIAGACDQIAKDNPSAEQVRLANQIKLTQISSTYDIVTNADPFAQLLDLVLVVTLQSQKWIDEDLAEEWFDERAQPLISASRKAREDVWKIAARVMKPEQLEVLDYLIWDWRRKNADVQIVSWVRFDDFSATRGKSVVADVATGKGLLAPVDEAKKAVDEVRLLTERAFYYSKRMPFLMNWQVKAAMDDSLENPQIKGITASIDGVTKNVDEITGFVTALPNEIDKEHQRVVRDVQRMHPLINTAFSQYRGAVAETDGLMSAVNDLARTADALLGSVQETTKSLNTTMTTVDKIFMEPGRSEPKPKDAKPFVIAEYAQTAAAVADALKEANQLVGSAGGLIGSPQIEKPIQQINAIATERVEQARQTGAKLIDTAFWRGAALIILFFVCLAIYKFFSVKILGSGVPRREA